MSADASIDRAGGPERATRNPSPDLDLSLEMLRTVAASQAEGAPISGGTVLDAVLAAGRVIAWAQAQQLRWLASFAGPDVAVPIAAILTALSNKPDSLLPINPVQPDADDFAPGTTWEHTSVYGDPVWDNAIRDCAMRFASAEASAAMRIAPITASAKLANALMLRDRLPATHAALEAGTIDFGHVAVMLEATNNADDAACAAVEDLLVAGSDPAGSGSAAAAMTPGQLGRAARAAVMDVDPEAADRQAEAANARRGVGTRALGDNMARLYADLLATDAAVAMGLLDALADGLPAESRDGRDAGQLRADIFADLFSHLSIHGHIDLRGTADCSTDDADTDRNCTDGRADATDVGDEATAEAPAAASADTADCPADTASDSSGSIISALTLRPGFSTNLDVTVAFSTLVGMDDCHAQLAGHGAITADLARAIAAAFAKVTITPIPDPDQDCSPPRPRCDHPGCHGSAACGTALDRGGSMYQPPDAVADHVRHRDRVCRFPGCQRSARRCDLDHRIPFADGGSTCPCDLDCLCRFHHRVKTFTRWRAVRVGNTLTWTSPLGRTYTDPPQPRPTGTPFGTDPLSARPSPTNDEPPPF